jgi:FkbM family methyltransferase
MLKEILRKMISFSLEPIFIWCWLRKRITFELKRRYFHELEVTVPLGHGFQCPIYSSEAWCSFQEIFIESEYREAFDRIPYPVRWIDFGCYAGYFSLWLAYSRSRNNLSANCEALLVDADSRVEPAVKRLLSLNNLERNMVFRLGMISAREGKQRFIERPFMFSSAGDYNLGNGEAKLATVLTEEEIFAAFPPPYDLFKIDIEGAETAFFLKYRNLLSHVKALLLEWHSWDPNVNNRDQVIRMAEECSFSFVCDIAAARDGMLNGKTIKTGVILFTKTV